LYEAWHLFSTINTEVFLVLSSCPYTNRHWNDDENVDGGILRENDVHVRRYYSMMTPDDLPPLKLGRSQ